MSVTDKTTVTGVADWTVVDADLPPVELPARVVTVPTPLPFAVTVTLPLHVTDALVVRVLATGGGVVVVVLDVVRLVVVVFGAGVVELLLLLAGGGTGVLVGTDVG